MVSDEPKEANALWYLTCLRKTENGPFFPLLQKAGLKSHPVKAWKAAIDCDNKELNFPYIDVLQRIVAD